MLKSSKICPDCIGRVQQLRDFQITNQNSNPGKQLDLFCHYCYEKFVEYELLPESMNRVIVDASKNLKLTKV